MQRYRQVAAAPKRTASDTWDAITQLVVATLERSPNIAGSDVVAAMSAATPVGRMLVAGGHLDKYAVVVIADPVYLTITTVSGPEAVVLDEDTGPVPGGSTATEWTIYLPTPDPLGDIVRSAIVSSTHLNADEPPAESVTKSSKSEDESALNLDALAQRAQERK